MDTFGTNSHPLRFSALLLAVGLTGCGTLVIPVSAPTMTATSMVQRDPGTVGVDVGYSPMADLDLALTQANLTGLFPVSLNAGIAPNMDISATFGAGPRFGNTGGVQLGRTLLDKEPWRLGMTAGLGVYEQHGTEVILGQPVVDENGNPVYDEYGNPVMEPDESIPYRVLGLAPSVGVRSEWRFARHWSMVGGARLTYSRYFSLYGNAGSAGITLLDPELGIVAAPLKGLKLGLGVSLAWPMISRGGVAFGIVPCLSASYSLPVWKPAAAASNPGTKLE